MYVKSALLLFAIIAVSAGTAFAQEVTYRVKPRDTLFLIARNVLGDQTRWEELCEFNKPVIAGNCGYVQAGTDILLPPPRPDNETPFVGNVFTFDMHGNGGGRIAANTGYSVALIDDVARLSGFTENPTSTGYTGGIYLRLPDAVERALSGRRVRVEFDASASADGAFQAAYSTADVGNSGWTNIAVTADRSVAGFEFDIPSINNGNGDFIGILPDPQNNGVRLDLHSVVVTLLDG